MWIDTHCHLDAPEFDADRDAVVARARAAGVAQLVLPAVEVAHFAALRALAHSHGFAYALGIHPLYVQRADDEDLARLDAELAAQRDDPLLVAVGEIGLDHFVPGLDRERQERFYVEQLKIARRHGLPVILHVRRSADALLKHLRRIEVGGGIAHAFNGSAQQAQDVAASLSAWRVVYAYPSRQAVQSLAAVDRSVFELARRSDALIWDSQTRLLYAPDSWQPDNNIYGTNGDWELYSTPSRDARLKASVREINEGPEDRAIVAAIVGLGHNLGLAELHTAIAGYMSARHPAVTPDRVAVTSGGVNALMLAVQALV